MKALEPYPKKLGTDTWFYAKRTFLALAETLAKHVILLKLTSHTCLPATALLPLTSLAGT